MCRSGEILAVLGSYFKVNSFGVRARTAPPASGRRRRRRPRSAAPWERRRSASTSLFYFTFISSGSALFHIPTHRLWHSRGMFHFKKRFFILILPQDAPLRNSMPVRQVPLSRAKNTTDKKLFSDQDLCLHKSFLVASPRCLYFLGCWFWISFSKNRHYPEYCFLNLHETPIQYNQTFLFRNLKSIDIS